MLDEPAVLRLVDALYESALNSDRWPAFLELLSHALAAPASCVLFYDATDPRAAVEASIGLDPAATKVYGAHYGALDPWAQALALGHRLRPGVVCTGDSLIALSALRKTE